MAEQFAWELRFHPQRPQVDFILDGIHHGFKLRKRANQANGVSLWICLPPGGLVSMMGLAQMSLLFITSLLIKLFALSRLGKGALMAKFDVESAYRNVPVHPSDRHLLGMKWCNQSYVDLALSFGLLSPPFIFNAIADLVE